MSDRTDRRSTKPKKGAAERAAASSERDSGKAPRAARARFDNLPHPGRHSPVRKALRLPPGPLSDLISDPDLNKQPIPRAEPGRGGASPAPGAKPDPAADGCRGALAGTGPLAKWPRSRAETSLPSTGRTSCGPDRLRPDRRTKLDPWAEDQPAFGQREVAHALSPTPGTPPHGHLAIEPPRGWSPSRRRSAGAGRGPLKRKTVAPAARSALGGLREPVRVELELEHCGRWTCGLAERASIRGMEVSLGHRGVGTRDFLSAGRRVRVLVSARGERPFQLRTRVLWVDPPSGPVRAVHAQLAVETADAAGLARWQGLVERLRG